MRRYLSPSISSLSLSHYVLLAVLFFVGLELIEAFHRWIIIMAIGLLILLMYGIALLRIEEREHFKLVQAVLPVMAATGLTGFAFFLPKVPLIHAYFALAALLFYFLLRQGARMAYPTWNWMISTIVLFVNLAIVLGLRFHLYWPVIYTLGLVCLASLIISWQAFYRVIPSGRHTLLLSVSLALVLTEVSWILLFLPLHYFVQAGILVTFYYVSFHLLTLGIENKLARRQILEYIGLGLAAFVTLLLTARWT